MAARRKLGTTAVTVISVPHWGQTKVMSARSESRSTTVSMSSSDTVMGPSMGQVIENSIATASFEETLVSDCTAPEVLSSSAISLRGSTQEPRHE